MTTTKEIRTSYEAVVCDVCGRTLLRGERADVYFAGAARRLVCELCKPRALHEGWVREGAVAEYEQGQARGERRRPLFARLRRRRSAEEADTSPQERAHVADPRAFASRARGGESSESGWPDEQIARPEEQAGLPGERAGRAQEQAGWAEEQAGPQRDPAWPRHSSLGRVASAFLRPRLLDAEQAGGAWFAPEDEEEPRPDAPASEDEEASRPAASALERGQERRHAHAAPAGRERECAAAVEFFNRSEHCRTVAGIARSLGAPLVRVEPIAGQPGLVELLVAWELCWYRYEVDLAAEEPSVRVADQGAELAELGGAESVPNAHADERGHLSLAPLQ